MSTSRTAALILACLLVANTSTTQADALLNGETLFRLACQACHALGPEASTHIGPRLDGIAGESAGTLTNYPYSVALKQSGLVWNRPTLVAWITGAERIVPGTLMAHHNVLTGSEIRGLADHLLAYPASTTRRSDHDD